jgi:hypothetical protein
VQEITGHGWIFDGDHPAWKGAWQRAHDPTTWPTWARALAMLREPQDRGLGDTVRRTLGPIHEAYSEARRALGATPCKCRDRQTRWNHRFPYVRIKNESLHRRPHARVPIL